jgi:hypothetical protein
MEAGYAHKMGIGQVYQGKAGMEEIAGPVGGGHIPAIDLCGKDIEGPHRINKSPYLVPGPASQLLKEKTQGPYPEIGKVKVNVHPAGVKGNGFVKLVIHLGKRYEPRIPGRFILKKEKI